MINLPNPLTPEPNSDKFDASMALEMWGKHSGMFTTFTGRAYQKPYSEDSIFSNVQAIWHMPSNFPSGMIATNIRMNHFSPPVTRLLWEYLQSLNPTLQALKLGDNHIMRTRVLEAIDCRRNLEDIQWMISDMHYETPEQARMFLYLESVVLDKSFGYYPAPNTLGTLMGLSGGEKLTADMRLRAERFHAIDTTYDQRTYLDFFAYRVASGGVVHAGKCTPEMRQKLGQIKNLKKGDTYRIDRHYQHIVDTRDIGGQVEYTVEAIGSYNPETHSPHQTQQPMAGIIAQLDVFEGISLPRKENIRVPNMPNRDLLDGAPTPSQQVIVIQNTLHNDFRASLGSLSIRGDFRQKSLDIIMGVITDVPQVMYQTSILEDLLKLGFSHQSAIGIDTLNYIVLNSSDREAIADFHQFLDILTAIPLQMRSSLTPQQCQYLLVYAEYLAIIRYLEEHRGFDSDSVAVSDLKQYSASLRDNFSSIRDMLVCEFGYSFYGPSQSKEFTLIQDFDQCQTAEELYWQMQLRGLSHDNLHNLRTETEGYLGGDITEIPNLEAIDILEREQIIATILRLKK